MEMKKYFEHGKIWLIACMISFGSFLFLQIDSYDLPERQQSTLAQSETVEDSENEDGLLNLDFIKSLTQFVVDLTKLNL